VITGALLALFLELQDGWGQVWNDLEALRGRTLEPAEEALVRARLETAARAESGGPRLELLRVELEHLAGRDVRARAVALAALEPLPFSPRELWFLTDPLPAGEGRARCVVSALGGSADLLRWQVLLAWNVGVDEARALRYRSALPIQEELHRRFPEEWSSIDLALTYRHLGMLRELGEVFEGALARAPSAELWSSYAIATLGSGDERRARDYLGRALALGSDDAGRVLGRLELVQGRREASRATFRAILQAPPPDWAWRGWGTTLLPDAFAPPVTISPTTSHE
jgi:tetratricopeptide (TPR) repeat protein